MFAAFVFLLQDLKVIACDFVMHKMSNDQGESHVNHTIIQDTIQALFKRPPFPPEIDPAQIAKDRILRNPDAINSRGPNCFIIYRTYCTSINAIPHSRKRNRIHMTKLSAIVAESWKNEPSEVKDYYKHLATLTEIEMCKERRRNEIHIVNFKGCDKRHQHKDKVNITKVPHFERQTPELPMEENNIDDEGCIPVAFEPIGNETWDPVHYKPLVIFRCFFHEFLDCPCQNSF
ncbi:49_t:CDS:1 [Acaulospora morrowiae]|uniref:49_t:CDS:1 n=1 Tax=Acaulospora morrowiae TaxID=94023 RepID=A0A9N9F9Y4_9GLOM|nr:49_t:CDS:1 [Acaulospora morrowiae]